MTSAVSNKTCGHCNGYGNCPAGFSEQTICTRCDVNGRKVVSGECRPCRGRGRVKGSLERRASYFPSATWQTPTGVDWQPQPMATEGCWAVEPGGYGPGLAAANTPKG